MNKIKIALASFLIVNSFVFAEGLTEFQTKAVKDLYNKGILQTIVKEEDFSKKDSFSRGEIATIIYNTLALRNTEVLKTASVEDIVILKALVSDFSSELAKLGAKDYELLAIIDKKNETVNKRIDDEVLTLNKKIDRINVTGDLSIVKEFDRTKGQNEFMKDLSGEGEIDLNLKISETTMGKIGYDLENEQGIYSLNVKKDGLNFMAFNDETINDDDWANWTTNKDEYGNLIRESKVRDKVSNKKLPNFDNPLGIIDKAAINNKDTIVVEKQIENRNILALATSTADDDIAGIQFKTKMKSFMNGQGADANMKISYVKLDDKTSVKYDKTFLNLGADFIFPINSAAKQTVIYNYSKMHEDSLDNAPSGNKYVLPVVSDEATYAYGKTELESKKFGNVNIVLGAVNTGYNFDASRLADYQKQLFAESDKIKLDRNIYGGIVLVKNKKGAFENTFSAITYRKNDNSTEDATTKGETLYSLKDGKTKVGLGIGQNTETDKKTYRRQFVEGKVYLTDVTGKNTTNLLKLNLAKEESTKENEITAYVDQITTKESEKTILAGEYMNTAAENSLKVAMNYQKTGKLSDKYTGIVTLGGRYDKDYDAKTNGYQVFGKVKVETTPLITLEGGARYGKGRSANNGITYAGSVTYKIDEDVKVSAIYGPISVVNDYSTDIFENKTDGIYGDADQTLGSIKVSIRF